MQIDAIYNSKGGVGKTFTATTLAHAAALSGENVLVVDIDTQGQISNALGLEKCPCVYDWLVKSKSISKLMVGSGRVNLSTLLGNQSTELVDRHFLNMAEMEIEARGSEKSKFVLAIELIQDRLNGLFDLQVNGKSIDRVIFDCPPRRSNLVEAVIGMADTVIVPTTMSVRDVEGTEIAIAAVSKINSSARIIISPNRVDISDKFNSHDKRQLAICKLEWLDVQFASHSPTSKIVKSIEDARQTIWEWKGDMPDTLKRVKATYCDLYHMVADTGE